MENRGTLGSVISARMRLLRWACAGAVGFSIEFGGVFYRAYLERILSVSWRIVKDTRIPAYLSVSFCISFGNAYRCVSHAYLTRISSVSSQELRYIQIRSRYNEIRMKYVCITRPPSSASQYVRDTLRYAQIRVYLLPSLLSVTIRRNTIKIRSRYDQDTIKIR